MRTVNRCLFSGERAEVDAAAQEEGGRLRHSEHDPPQRLEKGRQAILNTESAMMINLLNGYEQSAVCTGTAECCASYIFSAKDKR
jgi:hypothetical protein